MIHKPPIHTATGILRGTVILLDLAKQDAYLGPEQQGGLSFKSIPRGKSSSAIRGQTRLSVASRKNTPGPQDHSEFKWVLAIGKNCLKLFTPLWCLSPSRDNPGPHVYFGGGALLNLKHHKNTTSMSFITGCSTPDLRTALWPVGVARSINSTPGIY